MAATTIKNVELKIKNVEASVKAEGGMNEFRMSFFDILGSRGWRSGAAGPVAGSGGAGHDN